jgi:hypothetical protein
MSFDVFLQCFGGDPTGVSRFAVRALFPIVEEGSEENGWSVCYDRANSCRIRVIPARSNRELITSLSVNRPCGDVRFWESVLAILRMGPMMLYWPGGGPLVGSEARVAEFPEEIAESLGQPLCVGSAQEIMDAIRES